MRAFIPLLKITRIIYVTIQESFNMTSERTKNGAPVTQVTQEIGHTPLQACEQWNKSLYTTPSLPVNNETFKPQELSNSFAF